MKLFLLILLGSYSALSMAAPLTGRFELTKEISDLTLSDADCLAAQGKWISEDEICLLEAVDSAVIKKSGDRYKLHIETMGNNAHSCSFEGSAKLVKKNTLLSKVKVEKGFCEVTATLRPETSLDIKTNMNCQSLCGVNAWLDTENLSRVN